MSLIDHTLHDLDAQFNHIYLSILKTCNQEATLSLSQPKIQSLNWTHYQKLIDGLSYTYKRHPILSSETLLDILSQVNHLHDDSSLSSQYLSSHESELLWLISAKATAHSIGLAVHSLLDQALEISNEIWYWDEVLGSFWYTGLYSIQTSPSRIWKYIVQGYPSWTGRPSTAPASTLLMSIRWSQFHQFIQQSVLKNPISYLRIGLPPSFVACRSEAQQKRGSLKAARSVTASSIGFLVGEWLSFKQTDRLSGNSFNLSESEIWHNAVRRSVAMLESVLQHGFKDLNPSEFESTITAAIGNKSDQSDQDPRLVIKRLAHIHQELLPRNRLASTVCVDRNGRPSRLVRYWLPLSFMVFSTSTIFNFIKNRRSMLIQSVVDAVSTSMDFWHNWVLGPLRKLIGTIRHDETSEIAIMSKNSLEADRASLERMVVDFIRDRPGLQDGALVADTDTLMLRVKEGDLTPVLRAYERDLRAPFSGAIRGDLVRALLIQIQKTKVDVEIAMSGINALLKSQELVFGFVGLTPGILVSYAVFVWTNGLFSNRKGLQVGKKQTDLRRAMRNVSRALTLSNCTTDGILSYKDYGLLICETEVLLQKARATFQGTRFREFREDVEELLNLQHGIDTQHRVLERITWVYSKSF